MRSALTLSITLAGILTASHSWASCSQHDQLCIYHGVGRQQPTVDTSSAPPGLHTELSWDSNADIDIHGLLPPGEGPYILSPPLYPGLAPNDTAPFHGQDYGHVKLNQHEITFNNGQAVARKGGDTHGFVGTNPTLQSRGEYFECNAFSGSCEIISVTGDLPDGVYTYAGHNYHYYDPDEGRPSDPYGGMQMETGNYHLESYYVGDDGVLVTDNHSADTFISGTLNTRDESTPELAVKLVRTEAGAQALGSSLIDNNIFLGVVTDQELHTVLTPDQFGLESFEGYKLYIPNEEAPIGLEAQIDNNKEIGVVLTGVNPAEHNTPIYLINVNDTHDVQSLTADIHVAEHAKTTDVTYDQHEQYTLAVSTDAFSPLSEDHHSNLVIRLGSNDTTASVNEQGDIEFSGNAGTGGTRTTHTISYYDPATGEETEETDVIVRSRPRTEPTPYTVRQAMNTTVTDETPSSWSRNTESEEETSEPDLSHRYIENDENEIYDDDLVASANSNWVRETQRKIDEKRRSDIAYWLGILNDPYASFWQKANARQQLVHLRVNVVYNALGDFFIWDTVAAGEDCYDDFGLYTCGNVAVDAFKPTKVVKKVKKGYTAVKRKIKNAPLRKSDFPKISSKVSPQKQDRHVKGTNEYRGGGTFNSQADAQKVLDAYHSGNLKIIGKDRHGNPVVKFYGVTGMNNNASADIVNQPTNTFLIKGTKSPSVVPINPYWTPKS